MATYPIKMLRDEDRQAFVPFTNAAAVVDSNSVTLQELMTNGKYKIQNNVTTSSAGKGVLDAYQGKVLNDKFSNYVPLSQKGVANGVATLDGDAKVPTAQLPSYVDDVIEAYTRSGATALSSTWLSLTDGGAALTPEKGKIYVIMSSGSYQNKQYRWGGSTYVLCNPSDVNSVNGFTGVVVLKELTIQKNGTQVGDKFNGSANKTINITVPTKTSDITNNSGFITAADDITGNAATATNATNDSDGNAINTTYLKKSGGTMNGAITFANGTDKDLTWAGDTYQQRIKITDDATANTAVFEFQQSTNSASTWPTLMTIKDNGEVVATKFTGALNGNATTATKATQDGSGNIITDTYVKKAGDTMTGTLVAPIIQTGSAATNYFQSQKFRGQGDASSYQHALDFGYSNHNQWDFYEYGGVFNFHKHTAAAVDEGDTLLGTINSNGWEGNVKGNVTGNVTGNLTGLASKATGDKNGLDITNYIKGLSISGTTLTYTKGDDTTGTLTTYTLPVAGTGINGTLGGIKVGSGLSIDGTTGVLSATGGGTADNVEWSGVLNKPTNISYWANDSGYITLANVMAGATASTAGSAGVVPKPNSGDQAKFLRGDGQWSIVAEATKATQDGSGNTITSTYVKKAGDTMTGLLEISKSSFGGLKITRSGATSGASIMFANSNGTLGYIGMTSSPDGGILRWSADTVTSYTVLDTGNYTSTLDGRYVKKAGDTMTGDLSFASTKGISFNGTSTGESKIIYNSTDKCIEFVFA